MAGGGPTRRATYDRRMKQLSGVDVSFLNMETSAVYGHVASMTIYDPEGAPGGAGVEATKQVILERIDQLAPFRRRLVEVPLGLDLPYWIEDPDFDIDFHVRHHAVPAPGTPEQLSEVVSRIHARPLDRRRPLWELYVIEGVDGGTRIAQLTKVHHATIDGASGALMLAAILDTEKDARPHGEPAVWTPDRVPSDTELLQRTMLQYAAQPREVHPVVGPARCAGSAPRRAAPGCGRWPISSPNRCPARSVHCSATGCATPPTRSTTRRRCRRRRRPAPRGTRPSRRIAASPTRRSRSTTPRRSAAPPAARSTTSSWPCARACCGST